MVLWTLYRFGDSLQSDCVLLITSYTKKDEPSWARNSVLRNEPKYAQVALFDMVTAHIILLPTKQWLIRHRPPTTPRLGKCQSSRLAKLARDVSEEMILYQHGRTPRPNRREMAPHGLSRQRQLSALLINESASSSRRCRRLSWIAWASFLPRSNRQVLRYTRWLGTLHTLAEAASYQQHGCPEEHDRGRLRY